MFIPDSRVDNQQVKCHILQKYIYSTNWSVSTEEVLVQQFNKKALINIKCRGIILHIQEQKYVNICSTKYITENSILFVCYCF